MGESEKKYGIEELKKVVDFAADTHMSVDKSLADGKIDVADAPLLMAPAMSLFAMIGVITKVPAAFAELDEEEKSALIEYAKVKYDIADDKVEKLVEKSFALAVAVGDLIHDAVTGDDDAA